MRDGVFIGILDSQGLLGKFVTFLVKGRTIEFLFLRNTWVSNYLDFPNIQDTSYPIFILPRGEEVPPFRRPCIIAPFLRWPQATALGRDICKYNTTQTFRHESFGIQQCVFHSRLMGVFRVLTFYLVRLLCTLMNSGFYLPTSIRLSCRGTGPLRYYIM